MLTLPTRYWLLFSQQCNTYPDTRVSPLNSCRVRQLRSRAGSPSCLGVGMSFCFPPVSHLVGNLCKMSMLPAPTSVGGEGGLSELCQMLVYNMTSCNSLTLACLLNKYACHPAVTICTGS